MNDRLQPLDITIITLYDKLVEMQGDIKSIKTKTDIFLGNGKEGEFQALQRTVREQGKALAWARGYFALGLGLFGGLVTIMTATHEHWIKLFTK